MKRTASFATCVLLFIVTGCSPSPLSANSALPAEVALGPHVYKSTFYSPSLRKQMQVNVYLPPGYSGQHQYPVLYVFHGKDGTADSWLNGGRGRDGVGVDSAATQLIQSGKIRPLIIVSPELDNSYGINTARTTSSVNGYSRGMYENYIIKDLVPYIDQHYNTIPNRSGRFVAGLSMGGFAALHDAFLHPELFSKVGVMSAALWIGGPPDVLSWIYPTPSAMEATDPITIAQRGKVRDLVVDIIEGDSDPFVHADHALYIGLQNHHVNVQYHLDRGAHDYIFWRHHASDLLMFFGASQS